MSEDLLPVATSPDSNERPRGEPPGVAAHVEIESKNRKQFIIL